MAASLILADCAGVSLRAGDLGKTRQTSAGEVLVDGNGNTLYIYDPDPPGASTCTGACAVAWPPAEADENAQATGQFTIITRPNGKRQWAYKDKPLYGYRFDSSAGTVAGDGVDGVWHVARP